jgi:hypothetical protein
MNGMIVGGWEYVWGAYGLTFAVLAGYGISLWLRQPRGTGKEGS